MQKIILTFEKMMAKQDIRNRADIDLMVRTFYDSLLENESIKPVFDNLNFEAHIPHIVSFWAFVLLDEEGYKTNVFDKHINLPIKEEHFEIWLHHFENTINELFEGEKAELAKLRAQTIAFTFKEKFRQMGKFKS